MISLTYTHETLCLLSHLQGEQICLKKLGLCFYNFTAILNFVKNTLFPKDPMFFDLDSYDLKFNTKVVQNQILNKKKSA